MDLTPNDILDGFGSEQKRYAKGATIAGVELLPLHRHVDDRGLFLEIYRNRATHPGSEQVPKFFANVDAAQLNFSLVTAPDHVKGLSLPPQAKRRVVLPPALEAQGRAPRRPQRLAHLRSHPGHRPRRGAGRVAEDPARGRARVPAAHAPLRAAVPGHPLLRHRGPDEYRIPWDHPAVKDLWEVRNE